MPFPDIVMIFDQWLQDFGPHADPVLVRVGQKILREFVALKGIVMKRLEC